MLRCLGASASQSIYEHVGLWAAGYQPPVRVALEHGAVRGHKVGTYRFMYTAQTRKSQNIVIMPRFRSSQDVYKQPVYVAFILIRRKFEGVVIQVHNQAIFTGERGLER